MLAKSFQFIANVWIPPLQIVHITLGESSVVAYPMFFSFHCCLFIVSLVVVVVVAEACKNSRWARVLNVNSNIRKRKNFSLFLLNAIKCVCVQYPSLSQTTSKISPTF